MSEVPVNCGHCGEVFSVSDKMMGQSTACPKCKRQVAVLDSSDRPEGVEKLQLRKEEKSSGGKICPSCGAAMAPGVLICSQCGYDTRTGARYLDRPQPSRVLQWVLWGVGAVILVMLLKSCFSGKKEVEILGDGAVSGQQPAVTEAAGSGATGETAAAGMVEGGGTSSNAAVGGSTEMSPENLAKLEAEYREKLTQQLAVTYPMYKPGDAVVLRRVNGQIHRGALKERKAAAVVIVNGGQTNEIPLKVLDRASRLKCDPVFREEIVNFHVQKRAKETAGF